MAYQKRPQTRKPLTPAQQLQAAIARVQKGLEAGKDYRVAAQGKRFDTGEQFYCVPSDSEKLRGLWHVVTIKKTGLSCDCYFSQEKHQVCSHRAVVYLFLQAKAAAEKAAKKQEPAPAAPKVQPTKANALPYDAGEGFSIFKPERDEYVPRDYVSHQYR